MSHDALNETGTAREATPPQIEIVPSRWITRLSAAALDVVPMLFFASIPSILLVFVYLVISQVQPDRDPAGEWLLLAFLCVFSLMYTFGDVRSGGTLGKKTMALCIVSADGSASTWRQRLARWSIKVLPLLALLPVAWISFLRLSRHQSRQPLEDLSAFEDQMNMLALAIPIAIFAMNAAWMFVDRESLMLHDRVGGTRVGQEVLSDRVRGFEPILSAREAAPDATSTLPSANRDV